MSNQSGPFGVEASPIGENVGRVVAQPHAEGHFFPEPTTPVTPKFTWSLVIAQLVFFIALLGPAIIGIGIKVQAIVPDAQKESGLATVAGFGALAAVIGNVVFGRLSDRTTGRWGRRRPWIVGGTVAMTLAFLLMATSTTIPVLAVGWCLAQLGANAALAPFVATISDQVPKAQRGSLAALLGIAQNIGVLGGTYVAQIFVNQMVVMFVAPAVFAIVAMTIYAVVLPDKQLPVRPSALDLRQVLDTFWINPVRHPDFALAWWSRFLITLATFMFTTYRLFYIQDRLDISQADAPGVVTLGVLIYTIALVVVGWLAGKLSDRTGKRKFLVASSTLLFGVGVVLLAHATTVQHFYLIEALLGIAYGIYVGVDLALVVDVLPNPDDAGKDLGVFNMANALPQSLAPLLASALLGIGAATTQNYTLMLYAAGAAALIGAVVVLPIRKVK